MIGPGFASRLFSLKGRVALVIGGHGEIAAAMAATLADLGADVVLAARKRALCQQLAQRIEQDFEVRSLALACDVADEAQVSETVAAAITQFGRLDVLINNAGRSIRRAIENSYERFHDFERTMQLNYFACLRVTLGLLPGMVAKRSGHVVNISSIGVLTNAPRFSAYVASKAALDAWTRCAASEFADQGITFTTINMPLVRTPMIAPTRIYDSVPALDPEEAAALVVQACIERPVRLSTRLGVFGELLHTALPRVAQIIMNTSFRMFPENTKTDQSPGIGETELSAEALALQQMMKGLHF